MPCTEFSKGCDECERKGNVMGLFTCPTCKGAGTVTKKQASSRKGGSEDAEVECTTCDGSGQLEKPPSWS